MKTLLLGDVCPTGLTNPLFDKMDIDTLFGDTTTLFENNDINLVNLECALTEHDKDIIKFGPALKACYNTAKVLKQLGVNCCGLSNNHIFDFGKKGAMDTIKALEAEGILHTGFGENYEDSRKNLVIEKDGEKVCIIAVCEREYSYALENRMGARPFDEFETIDDIRHAKEMYDRVIVTYHGGKEYCRYPSPRLRNACRAMARNGADVVLCQHSHCIGCYELYDDCHILYGQGNFHFVKTEFTNETRKECFKTSLVAKYDTTSGKIDFIPLVANAPGINIAKGDIAKEIMDDFYKRNEQLKTDEWKQGWHDFCISMKDTYYKSIRDAANEASTDFDNHRFAHHLDCQAHTDVWRELFKTTNMTNEIE
ncbi:MAG: CapA family protein [Ruminococcaceae bacterium]|nr:CapA family protein [Oscillospiraceae bacterium]